MQDVAMWVVLKLAEHDKAAAQEAGNKFGTLLPRVRGGELVPGADAGTGAAVAT